MRSTHTLTAALIWAALVALLAIAAHQTSQALGPADPTERPVSP